MRISRLMTIAVVILVMLLTGTPVLADGIIIPEPPIWPDPPPMRDQWLTISYHHVDVRIEDQVAVTRVEQEFVNEHGWEAEGAYVFPLPAGAAISQFVMWVDGVAVEGQILEADKARAIYEDIVRHRRDPALLEYVGRDAIQARIFPIPPGGKRRIEIEYTQLLPVDRGVIRYVYPLNTEKFSARPLESVSVRVTIRSQQPIQAVYSPTHQDRVYVERPSEYSALIGYEENEIRPQSDFELIYTVGQGDVGLNLLTYRDNDEDGFFLLMVAPPSQVDNVRVIPKDVILVLDTSGSMDGEKIVQAKDALIYILDHLGYRDRFNIVTFSSGVRRYAGTLQPVSETRNAIEWVKRLEALGGTDIHRALLEALAQADLERPTVLIFLTDGQPTEGVTEIDQIIADAAEAALGNIRLFAFGLGDDVNTVLLDTLAQQHRGDTGYVRPYERIDQEISAFYERIGAPMLTDLTLDFGGVIVEEVYPHPLPDLFIGGQLILTGRYRLPVASNLESSIRLDGVIDGSPERYVYSGVFRDSGGDEFIARLWATRKIGYLLTQIRLHGENREWVDAIVELSLRYGVITPYTSFLIEEDDILTARGQAEAAEKLLALPSAPAAGAPAVEMADTQSALRSAESAGMERIPAQSAEMVRLVRGKTFLLRDDVWTDTAFNPHMMDTEQIGLGTDAYFEVLRARPDWGSYMALGERVIFVAEGVAYEIIEGEGSSRPAPLPTQTPEASLPSPSSASPTPPSVEPPSVTGDPAQQAPRLCGGPATMIAATIAITAVWGTARKRH
ncbi:MAG: VWA domain-containing protein [Chloroflexi bacterium]|nr:VWA domain-containing protein [Chloroflexota bacterium]